MPLEHLQLLAVLKTDNVLIRDGFLNRHGWHKLYGWLFFGNAKAGKGHENRLDGFSKIGGWHMVVGSMCGHDLRGVFEKFCVVFAGVGQVLFPVLLIGGRSHTRNPSLRK